MSDLQPTSVLYKTPAGLAAMKVFDQSMTAKTRTLLILVDGVKTFQDLCRFSPDPTQITAMVTELMGAGLVSLEAPVAPVVKAAPAASAAPTAAVSPAAPGAAPQDLKTSIRKATRALEDLLGPSSEAMCLQLEKCKTLDELNAKIQNLRSIVASSRSEKKAEEFIAKALG